MKRFYSLFSLFLFVGVSNSQNTWVQKANFGGGLRRSATAFVIGTKAYVGTGQDGSLAYKQDFWQYDSGNDTWTQKAAFPGSARNFASSFAIGTKGYIGLGYPNVNDFWEYDSGSNIWTQRANVGGTARCMAASFTIGNKGYVGIGYDNANHIDFWQYSAVSNSWTTKANFGGSARRNAAWFAIGGKGYIGTGYNNSNLGTSDFWAYDTLSDSWSQKANFGGVARHRASGFSIGPKGYIGVGFDNSSNYLQDFWEYDPGNNSWTQRATFGGAARDDAFGFSIGNKGYIGIGEDAVQSYRQDFWEYTPLPYITVNLMTSNVNCAGGNEGTASVTASGGTSPYTYSWSPGGQMGQTATGLTNGIYTVTVTDKNGCTQAGIVSVVGIHDRYAVNNLISIFPNPFTNQTTIFLNEEMKDACASIFDLVGKEIKRIHFSGKQAILSRENIGNGIYFCEVVSADGKVVSLQKIVVQ